MSLGIKISRGISYIFGIWLVLVAVTVALNASALRRQSDTVPLIQSTVSTGHRYIAIDQFGYRPQDPKFAVLVDPQVGYNASDSFSPSAVYEVRRVSDDAVVYAGQPQIFDDGKTQSSSGDRGHWFDFSSVSEPGSFYIYDAKNKVRSHTFKISSDVYRDVLKAAVRTFFYNRSGAVKAPPFADPRWSDTAAYLGRGQDGEARSVEDKDNASTARDLRGGWFDAGDTNKYVNNAGVALHRLLAAFRERPEIWGDDFAIPESGNGIPDILDEIQWELDWLKRMQQPDGGVLIKVGVIDFDDVSPPGNDRRPRYYAPVCSSSTITAAGVFAHAAIVFKDVPALAAGAAELRQRAVRAWKWYQANAKRPDCDTQEVKSGDDDVPLKGQAAEAVVAAVYLYASTAEAAYRTYVDANYKVLRPFRDIGWSRYDPHQGEALLYYTTLPDVNAELRQTILNRKRAEAAGQASRLVYGAGLRLDLYRSHIADSAYHWGSNRVRANYGSSNFDLITYDLAGRHAAAHRARALGLLQYFHGVNPQGMVYLSNMRDYGAEVSASEIYHTWFIEGTPWWSSKKSAYGPAPGFLVGGPNARYSGKLSPPANQPLQKSYRDWTGDWREKPWEITEPHIITQAAYIKLLSKFVSSKNAEPR